MELSQKEKGIDVDGGKEKEFPSLGFFAALLRSSASFPLS